MNRSLLIRRSLTVILPLLVLAAGVFGALSMIAARQEPEKRPVEVPPPLVRVMEVQPKNVQLTVHAEGTVTPRTASDLVPEVSGRVMWASANLVVGGFLEAGEELLKIDPREYELAVVRARSAIAQAKTRLATEEQESAVAHKEWEALGEGEPADLTLRKPQIAEAQAALASAQAAREQAEYDLERTVLRAPYAGRIRSKQVDVGQFVSRGTSVARIYAVDVAEVRVPIADSELAFVDIPLAYRDDESSQNEPGPRVTLRADFGGKEYTWQGRIVRTEGEIDPTTQMIQVVAQVNDPYGRGGQKGRPPLAVGMFVKAEILGNRSGNVYVLPRSVLRGENRILVVDENDRLYIRDVEVLRAESERVLVRSGLNPADRVVVSAVETAVNGMQVKVASDEPAPTGDSSSGFSGDFHQKPRLARQPPRSKPA
ncbi:MAG: efflux RND transporter periplasmic adaptor subunit [Bryobacterales bacterium]